MIYGRIGDIDKDLSRVVLGTGRLSWSGGGDEGPRLLDAFIAAGGTAFDTAHVYGDGASELALGRWVTDRGCRDDVVIVTKGGHPSLSDWRSRLRPEAVDSDLHESLSRLQVDAIDVYMLHRDDESVPVGEIVDMVAAHVRGGRVKVAGVSNWSHERIEEANRYAASRGLPLLELSSPHYSLAVPNRAIAPGAISLCGRGDALAWYRQNKFPVMAWSTQAHGFFSRWYPSPDGGSNGGADGDGQSVYADSANGERRRRVQALSVERHCTRTQIALAWLFAQGLDLYAVIGPGTAAHLGDSLGALRVELSEAEAAWLNLARENVEA